MDIFGEIGRCFLPSHEAFFFMWLLAVLGVTAVVVTIERWFDINRRTDCDAPVFFETVKDLLLTKNYDQAVKVCAAGAGRALPGILGAGIIKAQVQPALIVGAMTEESVHMSSRMEKRLNLLVMFGNVSTLLGLLGTVFGLIMSFAAVGRPGVAAVEKSAMLATGISAAMNATLVGLSISIPCVVVYAWLRARVDFALQEIDRYALAILKILDPPSAKSRGLGSIGRRTGEEEIPDIELTPMLNLMVILIPFLLTSSEFVKIGAIEMKLPESSQGGGGAGGGAAARAEVKLDLGIVITSKGFNLFSYFQSDTAAADAGAGVRPPDIPVKNGEYDFEALNSRLGEIKRKTLYEIVRQYKPEISKDGSIAGLYTEFLKVQAGAPELFADHENVKIVAEEQIKYNTVVAVMDAARGYRTSEGNVTMFPNVSIAGGIVQ